MASVYQDRKMLKWLPFQSLPEQGEDLKALYQKRRKRTKPLLSTDQYELMQYRFEAAWQSQETVTLTLFKNGGVRRVQGIILGADKTLGTLMLDCETVLLDDIVEIL